MNKENKTKEGMRNLIQEAIIKKLGDDFNVTIQQVFKTNTKRDGLTILARDGINNISPTIYLEEFYMRLLTNDDLDSVVDDILSIYEKAKCGNSHFDTSMILDFSNIKDKLFVRLINKHMNEELLKDIPYTYFLDDFAIIPNVVVEQLEEGHASFRVTNAHMEMWNVSKNELMEIAIANTRNLFGVEIKSMQEVLFGMKDLDVPFPEVLCPPIYVASNKEKLNGAAIVLYDDVLKSFANEHGNFYVIFSSIHECLFIPNSESIDLDMLSSMNQEVNDNEVRLDEVLGTRAYLYDEEKGFVI